MMKELLILKKVVKATDLFSKILWKSDYLQKFMNGMT